MGLSGAVNRITYENEGGVEVLVVLLRIVSVKLVGLLSIDGKEVGAGIIGSQWLEELFEGGVEARKSGRRGLPSRDIIADPEFEIPISDNHKRAASPILTSPFL